MQKKASKHSHPFSSRFYYWLRKAGKTRNIVLILSILTAFSVVSTYISITHNDNSFGPDPKSVIALMLVNLVLLLSLMAIVSRRIFKLMIARKKGSVGSRMQTRVVVMFSIIAIIPTILMGFFSVMFFNFGVQSWFNDRVNTAIQESVAVAESYLAEHKKIIRADILGMASDLNKQAFALRRKPQNFNGVLSVVAGVRKIPEAIVFQYNNKRILARTNFSMALEFMIGELSSDMILQATKGELVTLTSEGEDRVMALVKLENYFDTFLLVGRFVDNRIINHIELTKGAASEYSSLKSDISNLQIKFFMVFVVVSLLVLMAVVWIGIIFSTNLVNPIKKLVNATEQVKKGDWRARVPEGPENDEIATLSKAFNNMTSRLEKQRREIESIQRRAAWLDVARRVAHEIKNPLTPIYLAAERLKRKYSKEVADPNAFNKYTDTIMRHVNDMGKIVEEFVNYARMPKADKDLNDIVQVVKDSVFSRQVGSEDITFEYNLPNKPISFLFDKGQIERVVTNLLKNAEEAILENNKTGNIKIIVKKQNKNCIIEILDNGCGFPKEIFDKLTEPYVTNKTKGTGLGLAIVKRIIDDHNGEIDFQNRKNKGARVLVKMPLEVKGL